MSAPQNISHVAQQIEDALSGPTVSARLKQTGAQLLDQLRKPLQITAIGMLQSGKTSLINMMAGQAVAPTTLDAALVEIVYGPEYRTVFEYADGRQDVHDDPVTDVSAPKGVFRARLEIPAEQLFFKSYAEVRLTGVQSDDQNLLDLAAQTSAIAIWCSEAFEDAEQQLWSSMPEHIKDHGLLALTMADRQMMKGCLTDRMAALEGFVSEEFLGLYPVATLQAIAARSAGGGQQSEHWKLSGGEALCHAVERQASLGQSEDHDRAKMFLDQLVARVPADKRQKKSKPDTATARNTASPTRETDADPSGDYPKDMLDQALHILKAGADKMLGENSVTSIPESKHVITHCVDALQDLSELFSDVAATVPSVQELLEDVQEGTDMLLLLQLEENETSAADAVALMLQLKKEISATAYA